MCTRLLARSLEIPSDVCCMFSTVISTLPCCVHFSPALLPLLLMLCVDFLDCPLWPLLLECGTPCVHPNCMIWPVKCGEPSSMPTFPASSLLVLQVSLLHCPFHTTCLMESLSTLQVWCTTLKWWMRTLDQHLWQISLTFCWASFLGTKTSWLCYEETAYFLIIKDIPHCSCISLLMWVG